MKGVKEHNFKAKLQEFVNAFKNIVAAIMPICYWHKCNRKMRRTLRKSNDSSISKLNDYSVIAEVGSIERTDIHLLQDAYNQERERMKGFEEKAKINIVGATLAVTIVLGASNFIEGVVSNQKLAINFFSVILLIFAAIWMVATAVISIRVITDDNVFYTIQNKSLLGDDKELKLDYDLCIEMNRVQNLIRNNGIYTSYVCMRNALVCLLGILGFTVADIML